MNKKVILLLIFLYFFSILNYDSDGARIVKKYVPSSEGGNKETTSPTAKTSTGDKVFNPTGGGPLTESDLNKILFKSGVVNYKDYDVDDILKEPKLHELVTSQLGHSLIVIKEKEALISHDQVINTYDGTKYIKEDILKILDKEGIGVLDFDKNILDILRNKKVEEILKVKINIKRLISILDKESAGKIKTTCRKNAVWDGIFKDNNVIKFIKIRKECRYKCKDGKCIEKWVVEEEIEKEPVEEVKKDPSKSEVIKPEIKPVEIKKEAEIAQQKEEHKSKEKKPIIFVKPQPLSVEKISSVVKGIASLKCKPSCEHSCGAPNGCGGHCGSENKDIPGKCGNTLLIEKPENAAEAFEKTASGLASVTQRFLGWILIS